MDAPHLYCRLPTFPALVRGLVFKLTLTALAALVAWPVWETHVSFVNGGTVLVVAFGRPVPWELGRLGPPVWYDAGR